MDLEVHGRNDPGAILMDDFSVEAVPVSPVPEPAIWAMMIVGFGAIGGAMRHRRQVSVRFA
ncbi:MAG: PEPxxWA-CTERM sorting domain-containing protein [Sphingomonadaceae bacterium]|nr:PEPxxWA-CTERM sorting domain-containing protein [Sphingomonadaceae bacterium]